MASMVKYQPGQNEDAILAACEELEAQYERAEAHRLAWEARQPRRKGRERWDAMMELRRAALDHAGRP